MACSNVILGFCSSSLPPPVELVSDDDQAGSDSMVVAMEEGLLLEEEEIGGVGAEDMVETKRRGRNPGSFTSHATAAG